MSLIVLLFTLDGFDAITLELCSTWDMFDLGMLSIINAGREGTNRVVEVPIY